MNPSEFTQQHAPDGVLTSEQASQLLELAMEGDTGAGALESGGEPGATPGAEEGQQGAQASENVESNGGAAELGIDPSKAVVLAKDNVHTIPYQKLIDAREGEKHWKAQAEAAAAELAALRAQAERRAAAGEAPTQTDAAVATAQAAIAQGVDPAIFGDFSEEALAQGIQKLVDMRVQEQVSAALGKALAPIKEQQETQAVNSHFSAIYKAHPDADSIAESKELTDWVNAQPSFARAGYQAVLQNGTTEQVIEFFDQFKQATGKATQQPTDGKPDVAAAAQAALAKAKAQVPTSLSEIPAGAKAHHDEAEALMEMSDSNALNSFMGKSPEQIRALLERAL